jgi:hypothetical protein
MSLPRTLSSACALLTVSALGCASPDFGVNLAPQPLRDAGHLQPDALDGSVHHDADLDAAESEASAHEAGPVVRTVLDRSPHGNLDPGNLMHDGDFELSAPNSMQYPWFAFEGAMQVQLGAACRSGLRCAQVDAGEFLAGAFVWPDSASIDVSFYGKPTGQDCEAEAVGMIIPLDGEFDPNLLRIGPVTPSPVDGWCHYQNTLAVQLDRQMWTLALSARRHATGPVVFDDASIHATDQPAQSANRARTAVSGEIQQLVDRTRAAIRAKLPPHPPQQPKPVINVTGRRTAGRATRSW